MHWLVDLALKAILSRCLLWLGQQALVLLFRFVRWIFPVAYSRARSREAFQVLKDGFDAQNSEGAKVRWAARQTLSEFGAIGRALDASWLFWNVTHIWANGALVIDLHRKGFLSADQTGLLFWVVVSLAVALAFALRPHRQPRTLLLFSAVELISTSVAAVPLAVTLNVLIALWGEVMASPDGFAQALGIRGLALGVLIMATGARVFTMGAPYPRTTEESSSE